MEMEKMKKTLEAKILEEVTPEDICDFWTEMVNGYVKVDHTHTGKVSLECFDDFNVYDSIEDAAKDCAYTIVEWVFDNHDFALEWLEENGIDLEAIAETASATSAEEEETPEVQFEELNIITRTFSVGGGFFVDVTVTDDWLGNGLVREAWLYHNSIDKKDMVLSGSVKGETEDEFLEDLKANLYDGNCYIDDYRETYMDSFKAYDEWKERI